jgi:hypothetical protein
LEGDPFLHSLLEQIRPSILDISILQVAQTNGDSSEAHVQQLAAEWMADNADLVADWIAAAAAPRVAPATTEPPAEAAPIRIALVAPSASNDLAFTQSMVDAIATVGETVRSRSTSPMGRSSSRMLPLQYAGMRRTATTW